MKNIEKYHESKDALNAYNSIISNEWLSVEQGGAEK